MSRRIALDDIGTMAMPPVPATGYHLTTGVYNSGDRKYNGVAPADLRGHIKYNLVMRPGRAFFVDGKCLTTGYLSDEMCDVLEMELSPKTVGHCTAPYH